MTSMTTALDSFPGFLARLQARDGDAAREVFRRFARQLISLAHRQFGARLRHKVDPEDIVQSAYKSFFFGFRERTFEVGTWNDLWGLLTLITLRKCADRVEYHRAQCRDVAREVAPSGSAEREPPWPQAPGREPTPLEAAMLNETVEQLLAGLDDNKRPVLELSLQGYTTREISERVGRAERTVRLLREGVRKRLERMQREGP
jgi:RNA polymerase sigma-70 factor, ECF subfamily